MYSNLNNVAIRVRSQKCPCPNTKPLVVAIGLNHADVSDIYSFECSYSNRDSVDGGVNVLTSNASMITNAWNTIRLEMRPPTFKNFMLQIIISVFAHGKMHKRFQVTYFGEIKENGTRETTDPITQTFEIKDVNSLLLY